MIEVWKIEIRAKETKYTFVMGNDFDHTVGVTSAAHSVSFS